MAYRLDDTIAAVASAPGGALRGIVRISGADTLNALTAVFEPALPVELRLLVEDTVLAGAIRLGVCSSRLPCDAYVWPTRRSFTGEPTAEIHTLGSPPLVEAILKRLGAAGVRPAGPGEFTLRAFLNGRLDLTQAEAVLGAVDATTPAELSVALTQLAGGLAMPLGRLRSDLLDLLAHLEAGLDFADEDLPFVRPEEIDAGLAASAIVVDELIARMDTRHIVATLPSIVLVGWPNTGKSSLFNALAGKRNALISSQPATTRDYLTAEIELDGTKILLVDTAGIETDLAGSGVTVRLAAQTATAGQLRDADVELVCLDATRPLNAWEREHLASECRSRVVALTKTDLPLGTDYAGEAVRTSSSTGRGLTELRDHLRAATFAARVSNNRAVAATAVRCRDSLRRAAGCIEHARELVTAGYGEELVAAEIRVVLDELGTVVGATCTDDVLDRIFSRFCIGK